MQKSRWIVSYDAAVSDKAIDGDKVENRAWVNDSEEDIVDGPVIDPDVPVHRWKWNKSLHSSRNRPDGSGSRCCDRDR